MIRIHSMTAVAVALTVASTLASAQAPAGVQRSALHSYRVVSVADGLVAPWSIAFLPGGDMLVTEKPGRLRIIRNGTLLPNAVEGVPTVLAQGQGGLLEVALHPQFAQNRLLYLTYSKPFAEGTGATTAVARGRFENDRLTDVKDIFVAESRGGGHYGSRLVFDGNGYLFITVGDRQAPPSGTLEAHPAQDLSNHHGKVIRIHDDGRVPTDNPFVSRAGAKPEIWSYGHRNMQGMVLHPTSGELWITEHGPQGGDEVNLIKPGLNYGWPVIGYGVNYRTGAAIHTATHKEGMEQPRHIWVPSIGVSGLMIYTGDRFPGWKGSMFAGGMAGKRLARLTIESPRFGPEEDLLWGVGRVRDVRQGPDGLIYVAIDGEQGKPSPILRIEPAQ
jgi:glucose/arabinose dehydrogenase